MSTRPTRDPDSTRPDRDIDYLAAALSDLRTATSGDSPGYANTRHGLHDAANQFQLDKAEHDLSNAVTDYQAALRLGRTD